MSNPILQAMGAAQDPGTRNVQGASLNSFPNIASPSENQQPNIFELMNAKDPKAALELMAKQNPAVANVMEYANSQSSYKDAFYKMAKEKGIDPNSVIQTMRNMGFK